MRYLVLSDIHGNLEALEATLAAVDDCDGALVLGDLVGYGADPNAVVERIRALPASVIVRGNHDKVAAGLDSTESFNHIARDAIEWTTAVMTPANREWLGALPPGPLVINDTIEICHGAPFDEDVYVFDELDALRSLHAATRQLCLFGHTHVPAVYRLDVEGGVREGPPRGGAALDMIVPARGAAFTIDLGPHSRYLVNCGAVGQPRDGDPRAAYGIVDTEAATVTLLRVEYDVRAARAKVLSAGLPDILAQRLAVGR